MAKTLYQERFQNVWKTWLLMSGFLIVIILLGFAASWYFDSAAILYAAVAFSLFMNFLSYWHADKIALRVNRAKPLPREGHERVYNTVENLSIAAGLPMPKLYIIDDPAPNAFATGRNAKHAAVAVTSGLLQMMNQNELEGVLAHELSHVGNKDILVQTVVVVLVGFVAILSDIFLRSTFWGIGGNDRDSRAGIIFMIIGIIFSILAPIVATIIQLAVSRKREFLADASGALLTRYPEGLISALQKIDAYSAPMRHPSNATAHMYIANPFGSKGKSFSASISRLFMTHPPVADRIAALRGME
ncbi:MAG TPA: M48 family metalloprotease [Candidatus Paceibacterota bacterium]|nr:M48 family metalloprotease [Candidatus Paceibacterota bacterium]